MVSGERCWEGMRVGRPVTSGESAVCRHEQHGQNQGKTRPRTGRNELSDGQSRRRGFQTKVQQFMTPSATPRARNNPSLRLRGRRVLPLFRRLPPRHQETEDPERSGEEVAVSCGTPRRCAKMPHRCPQPCCNDGGACTAELPEYRFPPPHMCPSLWIAVACAAASASGFPLLCDGH